MVFWLQISKIAADGRVGHVIRVRMVEAQLLCLATLLPKMIHGLLKVIHGREVTSKEKEGVDTIGTTMVAVAAMEEVKTLLTYDTFLVVKYS